MGEIPPQPAAPSSSTPAPPEPCLSPIAQQPEGAGEPVLCRHCGRTASNGINCQGYCVADSGY